MRKPTAWQSRYVRRLYIVDGLAVTWAIAGAYAIRFGLDEARWKESEQVGYFAFSLALAAVWWLMLGIWGSRDPKVLGSGPDEYKRSFAAAAWLFGFVAVISYALQIETARGFVGLAFPAGVLAVLSGRWILRQHLSIERREGRSIARVLIISGPEAAIHLVRSFRSQPEAGYLPIAAHLPGSKPTVAFSPEINLPITGVTTDVESILCAIRDVDADAVAISAGVQMSPTEIRRLGWALTAIDVGMILAPALTDVAGPRIHTQPMAGLPLIHVSTPKLTGGKKVAKRTFDIVTAGLLVLALSPVFAALAVLVKMTSPGPIFYFQERIGLRGKTFRMVKFRSMKVNADAELQALLVRQGTTGKPLFKVENDPRITKIGRVLRKLSLDELPQLFNVLQGSMSLVGPRPQREGEVALYDDAAHRRLYVSPGMSGLWQVSGRSNLSWEESIRLDLYYVENWSLMGDVVILFKTFKAVFASTGAV
ncbi:sugar transferase [Arthrobacter sp. CDRTa11]|nr:sugar transferase [Arthrobacter sp. CDRTa11]